MRISIFDRVRTMASSSSSLPSSSACSSESDASASITESLLSRLKPSDLSRKRSVDRLPPTPPKGKRRARRTQLNEPKSITPTQRVSEFPGEFFCVSNKKLFCGACREELSLKKGVIANHVRSAKHAMGKSKRMRKEATERDITDALLVSDKATHPVGETLPVDHHVYGESCQLKAAVPLSKLDDFRELLEEHAFSLTDRRHMSDLVPFILSQEVTQVTEEMFDQPVSVIFDGTTRLGEALAIVIRFCGFKHEHSTFSSHATPL